MRAWLQIQIESCGPRMSAGLFQRQNFGVLNRLVLVGARSNFAA